MKKVISVIVPVYNVEKYVEKCVLSIINQTYKKLEIILVDDGSTDSSGMICDELAKKDKRIKVIHKKNGGLSDARNAGIEKATGELIGFIDSDDYIENNMLEELCKQLEDNDADISICGMYIEYEDGTTMTKKSKCSKKIMNTEEALINLNSYVGFDMSSCDKLYKISLFSDIRFPVGKKCEDYYTTYKVFAKAKKVVFFNTPLYHYYQREGSISRNKIMDDSYVKASLNQLKYFEENFPDISFVAHTAYAFANIAMYNRFLQYKIKCDRKTKTKLKKNVRKELKYILFNKHLSIYPKKIQALIFSCSLTLYKIIKR